MDRIRQCLGQKKNIINTRYEDLRYNGGEELNRIVTQLTGSPISQDRATAIAEKFSFENMSGRKPGQENLNSFFRKGLVGDWKNNFNREAREMFSQYAGNELIKLGYETDLSWV